MGCCPKLTAHPPWSTKNVCHERPRTRERVLFLDTRQSFLFQTPVAAPWTSGYVYCSPRTWWALACVSLPRRTGERALVLVASLQLFLLTCVSVFQQVSLSAVISASCGRGGEYSGRRDALSLVLTEQMHPRMWQSHCYYSVFLQK